MSIAGWLMCVYLSAYTVCVVSFALALSLSLSFAHTNSGLLRVVPVCGTTRLSPVCKYSFLLTCLDLLLGWLAG